MEKDMFKAMRLYHGLTQSDFASRLGVSLPTIGRVESGDLKISARLKARLLSNFDVNDHFLTFYEKLNKFS